MGIFDTTERFFIVASRCDAAIGGYINDPINDPRDTAPPAPEEHGPRPRFVAFDDGAGTRAAYEETLQKIVDGTARYSSLPVLHEMLHDRFYALDTAPRILRLPEDWPAAMARLAAAGIPAPAAEGATEDAAEDSTQDMAKKMADFARDHWALLAGRYDGLSYHYTDRDRNGAVRDAWQVKLVSQDFARAHATELPPLPALVRARDLDWPDIASDFSRAAARTPASRDPVQWRAQMHELRARVFTPG